MIENLHDERYQLENKQAWRANLPANIKWELGRGGAKNDQKPFWKYLNDRISKVKQYLNYYWL